MIAYRQADAGDMQHEAQDLVTVNGVITSNFSRSVFQVMARAA